MERHSAFVQREMTDPLERKERLARTVDSPPTDQLLLQLRSEPNQPMKGAKLVEENLKGFIQYSYIGKKNRDPVTLCPMYLQSQQEGWV